MQEKLVLIAALAAMFVALPGSAESAEAVASDAAVSAATDSNGTEVPELSSFANAHRSELVNAGVRKIEAKADKRTVHVSTVTSGVFFHWPKNVKRVTVNVLVPADGPVLVKTRDYSAANQEQYRASIEALIQRSAGYARQQTIETTSPSLRAP
ncbi:hypothetical protein [Caballeronia sp. ATUFL_M1_KS5A]|uniref:hypothetical protein n=1 Tax=Caballeronia sp. ATUFL_M1_KS5A TaxID=2921778 RepID=UPI0020288D4F|nr:hypothetical protein [Caballeronia sp. ATUFL_M1_KS5A]